MADLRPYTILENKHVGENAFICGAGPSFLDCINHPFFNKIHSHVVVSVNSSFIAMPWMNNPDNGKRYWLSNDALCRRWSYWHNVKKAKAIKIIRDSWGKYFDEIPDFLYFWPRPTSEGECNPDHKGLAYCSSVPTAIDLCIQMGIKRIFLLGVDHKQRKGHSHFWQFLARHKQPFRFDGGMAKWGEQTRAFDFNNIAYPALKQLADIKGVEVFNCSPESSVEVFKKITFEEAFNLVGA